MGMRYKYKLPSSRCAPRGEVQLQGSGENDHRDKKQQSMSNRELREDITEKRADENHAVHA